MSPHSKWNLVPWFSSCNTFRNIMKTLYLPKFKKIPIHILFNSNGLQWAPMVSWSMHWEFLIKGISVHPPPPPPPPSILVQWNPMYLLVYWEGLWHLTSMGGWPQRIRGSRRSRSAARYGRILSVNLSLCPDRENMKHIPSELPLA